MRTLEDVNSLEEAAGYLCMTPAKLTRLRYNKKIGFSKEGNLVTFTREVILAYVKTNTTAAAPANPHGLSDASLARVRGRAAH